MSPPVAPTSFKVKDKEIKLPYEGQFITSDGSMEGHGATSTVWSKSDAVVGASSGNAASTQSWEAAASLLETREGILQRATDAVKQYVCTGRVSVLGKTAYRKDDSPAKSKRFCKEAVDTYAVLIKQRFLHMRIDVRLRILASRSQQSHRWCAQQSCIFRSNGGAQASKAFGCGLRTLCSCLHSDGAHQSYWGCNHKPAMCSTKCVLVIVTYAAPWLTRASA